MYENEKSRRNEIEIERNWRMVWIFGFERRRGVEWEIGVGKKDLGFRRGEIRENEKEERLWLMRDAGWGMGEWWSGERWRGGEGVGVLGGEREGEEERERGKMRGLGLRALVKGGFSFGRKRHEKTQGKE